MGHVEAIFPHYEKRGLPCRKSANNCLIFNPCGFDCLIEAPLCATLALLCLTLLPVAASHAAPADAPPPPVIQDNISAQSEPEVRIIQKKRTKNRRIPAQWQALRHQGDPQGGRALLSRKAVSQQ